jgi:hypothetical protein
MQLTTRLMPCFIGKITQILPTATEKNGVFHPAPASRIPSDCLIFASSALITD